MGQLLIIDDSESVRTSVSHSLRSQGLTVVTAHDGLDGLNMLAAEKDITLALVDINMPNMDGFDFVERAKAAMPDRAISFVVLTAEISDKMKARGKKLGVRGWILKPFDGEQCTDALRAMLTTTI